jgi:predicted Zn-ribbon and HTH transcriptional regulator
MVRVLQCNRCHHDWAARRPGIPKVCPKCKSLYWNKPRKYPANSPWFNKGGR